jgi:signal transduction histidine kinase
MTVQSPFGSLQRLRSENHDDEDESSDETSRYLKTQFLRRVAHDIASPTGVTVTVLEELANEGVRPELVAMARRGLRRLLRLSEQLALAAELETEALSPDTSVVDLGDLVKDAFAQATGVDGRRDVGTSCSVPDERIDVAVDRKLVVTSIREIIGNALRLASSRVVIEVERTPQGGVVRVIDDGPGFPDEVKETLGQRFVPRAAVRGLGLSLSMAKDVVGAHGGTLRIETGTLPPSKRGTHGAAVEITLPLH